MPPDHEGMIVIERDLASSECRTVENQMLRAVSWKQEVLIAAPLDNAVFGLNLRIVQAQITGFGASDDEGRFIDDNPSLLEAVE
jgi:hypothetical protein